MLALRLRDAERLVGVAHLLWNLVPAVEATRRRGRVEHEVVEVQPRQVDAPGRDRLALADLERLEPLLGHPVGLGLDLRQLLDDLPGDARARAQLALVVFDDRAGLRDSRAICGGHDLPWILLSKRVYAARRFKHRL